MVAETDSVFAGSVPHIYDTILVPLIFEPYAKDLARRVAERSPNAVLETAAGSGVVTRALAPLLHGNTRYVVTDLNEPMLELAKHRQGADDRIEWRPADALDLPFEDSSFDAVCCQFGVMFFPDRIAGYREALRVLRPGGRFLFNSWDRIEENEFARVVTDALATALPHDPPRFLARTPHGYHDVRQIEAELRAAGFSEMEIVSVDHRSDAAEARIPALAYCQGTPLRNEIAERDPTALEALTVHAAEAIRREFGTGAVSGKIRAHVVSAVA